MNPAPVIWHTYTRYVDVETGEYISKREYKKLNYIKIKSTKYATVKQAKGTIEYTIECRRNPQTKIWGD